MNTPTTPADEGKTAIENVYLLQRLAMGIVILGADELLQRLRNWEQTIDANPEQVWSVKDIDDETSLEKLAYFMLGSLLRLEKGGVRVAATGIQVAQQTANTAANILRPVLDNPVTRLLQRPFVSISQSFEGEVNQSVRDGRFEDRRGRALAETTFEELVDELIDYLARNPEIIGLVRQQSTGLATVVVDNGRELIVSADTVLEAALRRLLRMTPRAELPESPLAGKPQEVNSVTVETDR